MSGGEVWTDWILHDGSGCPVVGRYVEVVCADGHRAEGVVLPEVLRVPCSLWIWSSICPHHWPLRVSRYRIRKPRALLDIIERAENLPAPQHDRMDS